MGKEAHGLLNPWKNWVGHRHLGMDFHDYKVEAQLKRGEKFTRQVASAHLQVSFIEFGVWW